MNDTKPKRGITFLGVCGVTCIICEIILLILQKDDKADGIIQVALGTLFLSIDHKNRKTTK